MVVAVVQLLQWLVKFVYINQLHSNQVVMMKQKKNSKSQKYCFMQMTHLEDHLSSLVMGHKWVY
eukprot:5194259-Ditylum_brightwellii.AAC.1